MNDQETLSRAKNREEDAFFSLLAPLEERIYSLCYISAGNRDDAVDLLQESVLRIWHAIALYQGDTPFDDWVLRICADVCTDKKMKASVRDGDLSAAKRILSGEENKAELDLAKVTECPENLSGLCVRAIHAEKTQFSPISVLRRLRFTGLALVLILLMLLISRCQPATETVTENRPSVTAEQQSTPPAAFIEAE